VPVPGRVTARPYTFLRTSDRPDSGESHAGENTCAGEVNGCGVAQAVSRATAVSLVHAAVMRRVAAAVG